MTDRYENIRNEQLRATAQQMLNDGYSHMLVDPLDILRLTAEPPTSALPDDVEKAMQRLERTYAAVWLKHRESLFVAGNVNTKDLAIVFSYINTLRAPVTKSATVPVLPTSEEDERIVDAAIKRRLSGETTAALFDVKCARCGKPGKISRQVDVYYCDIICAD